MDFQKRITMTRDLGTRTSITAVFNPPRTWRAWYETCCTPSPCSSADLFLLAGTRQSLTAHRLTSSLPEQLAQATNRTCGAELWAAVTAISKTIRAWSLMHWTRLFSHRPLLPSLQIVHRYATILPTSSPTMFIHLTPEYIPEDRFCQPAATVRPIMPCQPRGMPFDYVAASAHAYFTLIVYAFHPTSIPSCLPVT